MKAIRHLVLGALWRSPRRRHSRQSVKIKQGMLNVPALSPLWLLPDEARSTASRSRW